MRSRYCKVCTGWHDLDEPWPQACYRAPSCASGIQIIKDIEPYKAVAGDVAAGGKAPRIGSRREHREFLKRNGYVEVGNEKPKPRQADYGQEVSNREIRQTYEQLRDRK